MGDIYSKLLLLLAAVTAINVTPLVPSTVDTLPERDMAQEETVREQPVLSQADVERVLEEVMQTHSAVAVSAAVIEYGEPSASGAWGWAVKGERKMTPDTKMRIASLSKIAVGICAMSMAEEGIVNIDAPISDYWGASVKNPYRTTQPSIRTLMTHTSSLKNLNIQSGLSTLRAILSRSDSWRDMEPGNGGYWAYNNFGFCVLGTTLELASGKVLDTYFQERFAEPLEMTASFHAGTLPAQELAALYDASGVMTRSVATQAGYQRPTEAGRGASFYPGGLVISAVDLAKLVSVLANDGVYENNRLLSANAIAEMERAYFAVPQSDGAPPFEQCLVLRRQDDLFGQSTLRYHTGSAYGVYSLISYNPETGDGVIVLTTGAPLSKEEHGIYTLCAELSQRLYAVMSEKRNA